jgi:hypothetical protein
MNLLDTLLSLRPSPKILGNVDSRKVTIYIFENVITISDTVTHIGKDAFSSCTSLVNLHIGNHITTIGQDAFSTCTLLANVKYCRTDDIADADGVFPGTHERITVAE